MFNTISLFTGLGGLDYGFEAAGFKTRAAIEIDNRCCDTLRTNTKWTIFEEDAKYLHTSQVLDSIGYSKGDIDVLLGGSPCQPFSKSGYWVTGDTKRLKDPRAKTLSIFMKYIEDILPCIFVIENVHGISYNEKKEGYLLIEKKIKSINRKKGVNYQFSWAILNAANYGVPQTRVRFFLIAHRDGEKFAFPPRTHFDHKVENKNEDNVNDKKSYVTAWDAIGDIKGKNDGDLTVKGKWANLLPSIPEGKNYLWHTNRDGGLPLFGWRTRYWSFLLKLAKNRPSWTIQAQPGPATGPFHWKNRLLSVDEMIALQTLPKNLKIVGNRTEVQKQIGNAVPSLLAEIIARKIASQFFNKKNKNRLKFEVALKRPIPLPESIEPAKKKYHYLIGDHPDHP